MDFLFPKFCVGCGEYGSDLCKKCFAEMSFSEQICPECGKESMMGWTHLRCKTAKGMDGLIVIYDHQDRVVQKTIENIKFGFNRDMVREVLRGFSFESGEKFDMLVPVPLHFYRENWRGFNQAEEIALAVSENICVPVERVLKRTKKTKQQSLLSNRKDREKNVRGVFEIDRKYKSMLRGKKILLVDDVFTSGADMRECTRVLRGSGATVVWGLALAH